MNIKVRIALANPKYQSQGIEEVVQGIEEDDIDDLAVLRPSILGACR